MNAHRNCDKCSGKVALWMKGEEVYRVTARKDTYGEVEEFICNTCRFEKKNTSDWNIEGPRLIDRHSVMSQNKFEAPFEKLLGENKNAQIGAKKSFLESDIKTDN
jgi:NADH-quinone oxidoreductase subunit G